MALKLRRNFIKTVVGSVFAAWAVGSSTSGACSETQSESSSSDGTSHRFLCSVQDLSGYTFRKMVIKDMEVYPLNDVAGRSVGFQLIPVNANGDYFRLNLWDTTKGAQTDDAMIDYQFSLSQSNVITYRDLNLRLVISEL